MVGESIPQTPVELIWREVDCIRGLNLRHEGGRAVEVKVDPEDC
jgi:hypothetical protein